MLIELRSYLLAHLGFYQFLIITLWTSADYAYASVGCYHCSGSLEMLEIHLRVGRCTYNCNQHCLFAVIYNCRNDLDCCQVSVAFFFVLLICNIRSVSSVSLKLLVPMCFGLTAELCTSEDEVAWSKTALRNSSVEIINLRVCVCVCKGNSTKKTAGKNVLKWKHGLAWRQGVCTYLCVCTCIILWVYLSRWLYALMPCWHHAPLQCMHPVYFVLSIFPVLCWLLSQLAPLQKEPFPVLECRQVCLSIYLILTKQNSKISSKSKILFDIGSLTQCSAGLAFFFQLFGLKGNMLSWYQG